MYKGPLDHYYVTVCWTSRDLPVGSYLDETVRRTYFLLIYTYEVSLSHDASAILRVFRTKFCCAELRPNCAQLPSQPTLPQIAKNIVRISYSG